MDVKFNHNWRPDYKEALNIQRRLKEKLISDVRLDRLELLAGADVSYSKTDRMMFAGVLVFTYPTLKLVEKSCAVLPADFPYIPGLLSFREGPALLEAFKKLRSDPDLIMFDGQGIAHPRGVGLAAHLGIVLDKPSIGCAKTRLVGEYEEPPVESGTSTPLTLNGATVGAVVRTRTKVKPVFVSCGHRMNLAQAVEITLSTLRGVRLPEPIRQAHNYVNHLRKQA
jgi:deoxyribonuclease V